MAATLDGRKIVVGATYAQFCNWCREKGVSPSKAVFADGCEKVLGLELKESDIVQLGPISDRMQETLRSRIR